MRASAQEEGRREKWKVECAGRASSQHHQNHMRELMYINIALVRGKGEGGRREGAHVEKVAMDSRNRRAASLKLRVARRKTASYTLSRFLRSQSPPSSHSFFALPMPPRTAFQSLLARSSLHQILMTFDSKATDAMLVLQISSDICLLEEGSSGAASNCLLYRKPSRDFSGMMHV